jgi:broad specificity phosphatase PhoE
VFYLIRHGEVDYSNNGKFIFQGRGIHFAPLTENGIKQITNIANDERLHDVDLIVSSPYTRSLQSAAIISRILDIELLVEPILFEWTNDISYCELSESEADQRIKEYNDFNGVYPTGEVLQWENNQMMKQRLSEIFIKYEHYKKVIVVCHGMLMHALNPDIWAKFGEIIEYEFIRS